MRETSHSPRNDDLALTALRFAAGELSSDRAEAFAEQMAHDQAARDALSDAIRLSAAALGQSSPVPDPLTREAVREQVRGTWLAWLFPRRPYRGHPLAWAGLGGTVAASLTVFGVWLGDRPDAGQFRSTPVAPIVAAPSDEESSRGSQVVFVGPPAPPQGESLATGPQMPMIVEPVEVEPSTATASAEPGERNGTASSDEKSRGAFEKPARPSEVRAGEPANGATSVP